MTEWFIAIWLVGAGIVGDAGDASPAALVVAAVGSRVTASAPSSTCPPDHQCDEDVKDEDVKDEDVKDEDVKDDDACDGCDPIEDEES
ncbi:MAG: hypothetical protein JRI23_24945 [Deltaproteobacteria bacterium]|jgi:hypothetical protein|nr:hypothetical protein [Deltaproteobacteria bacterium]MBW2535264.1 hypothetical protein [Deltaproteobacteria bacterium]